MITKPFLCYFVIVSPTVIPSCSCWEMLILLCGTLGRLSILNLSIMKAPDGLVRDLAYLALPMPVIHALECGSVRHLATVLVSSLNLSGEIFSFHGFFFFFNLDGSLVQ